MEYNSEECSVIFAFKPKQKELFGLDEFIRRFPIGYEFRDGVCTFFYSYGKCSGNDAFALGMIVEGIARYYYDHS